MPKKFLERLINIGDRALNFIGRSNIFISICAASLTAWAQKRTYGRMFIYDILITFSATFLLYNAQRLFLSMLPAAHQQKGWYTKNKKMLFVLMTFALTGLYPLIFLSVKVWLVYSVSLLLGLLYFMPFSNFRKIPAIKSLLVGLVWVLVCVIAPTKRMDIFFCAAQCSFVSALCILFNIRDMEHDAEAGTQTLPVLYGAGAARKAALILLFIYLVASGLNVVSVITFLPAAYLTFYSFPQNHPHYYTFGVDGLILLQSILGILFLTW